MQSVTPPPPFEIRTVAIIGAGIAGRGFALACAAAGYHVVLEDVMPANLRRAEMEFEEMNLQGSSGSLDFVLTVEDAVRAADIAVDFVPDELESKLEIFSMIDRMAPPKTILCTPSDAQSITDLASCVYRPERCFAVRGDLVIRDSQIKPMVRLLYPVATDDEILRVMAKFLGQLGLEVRPEPDSAIPVLMKNMVSTTE